MPSGRTSSTSPAPSIRSPRRVAARSSNGSARSCSRSSTDVRFHRTGTKRIHHPLVGELDLRYEVMEPSADSGLTMSVYAAEPDSATQQALDLLASWVATPDWANAAEAGGQAARR